MPVRLTSKPWSPEKILYLGGIFFSKKKKLSYFFKKIEKKNFEKKSKKSSKVGIFTMVKNQNIFRPMFL